MDGRKRGESSPLGPIFNAQMCFQNEITGIEKPTDDLKWFQYHMTAMTEELGEVLRADKRWKTHRNVAYDPANKLEELADVFITAINIALYSGFSDSDIYDMVMDKIHQNIQKFKGGKTDANNSGRLE